MAGKPSLAYYAAALASLGIAQPAEVAMVGDDLWADVQGRAAGRPGGLAGPDREVPGGDAARLGHHPPPGVAERGRARADVSRMADYLSPTPSDWSKVAGPAGPAAARVLPSRRPFRPERHRFRSRTAVGSDGHSRHPAGAAGRLRSPRNELVRAGGERAPHRDPGSDRPPGAALRRRASRTTPRASPNPSATSAHCASSAASGSTRCRPTPAS